MVRLMLVVAAIAAGIVFAKGRLDDAGGGGAIATPPAATAQVPAQFRTILASQPDPMTLLRQRGALPGLGAIRRLAGRGDRRGAVRARAVRRRRQPRRS